MSGKRKATPLLHYDAKLSAVTRALSNLASVRRNPSDRSDTSDDEALTSGAFALFPLLGLRLQGEASDLPLPLTPSAVEAITQRATTIHGDSDSNSDATTSEIPHHELEIRNPHWRAFVDSTVNTVREPLGIPYGARVHATLRSLVLVQSGGRLDVSNTDDTHSTEDPKKTDGVFGTLVVVLPGEFTGGGVVLSNTNKSKATPIRSWTPGTVDRNAYGISYASFYNNVDGLTAVPITSGAMLCLVYDLVTTTIHEVPRFAGARVLEHALYESLTQFFEVLPTTKRLKISDDAWRTINEFSVDHRFVYPVKADAFVDLLGDDEHVANLLKTFCARTAGQYVLYLATLSCTSTSLSRSTPLSQANHSVYLKAPWCRDGDPNKLPFQSTEVKPLAELAPAGFLEKLQYDFDNESEAEADSDSSSSDDSDDGYYSRDRRSAYYCRTQHHQAFALVVQPATLEQALWAKMALSHVLPRIQELMETAPVEATRLARRVLANKPYLVSSEGAFARFVDMTIALQDASLFCELLTSVSDFCYESTVLSRAMRHFGWTSSCVAAVERVIRTKSFRQNVNLVCSVVDDATAYDHINQLMRSLVAKAPWAETHYSVLFYYDMYRSDHPSVEELSRLFALAFRCSPATLLELVGEPTAGMLTVRLIVPSLVEFVGDVPSADRSSLRPLLSALRDKVASSLPALRNAPFMKTGVYSHCGHCRDLHAFLMSTKQQLSVTVRNKTQLKHVETTVKRKIQKVAPLTMVATNETTLLLTKGTTGNELSDAAEACVASLESLLS